MNFCKRIFIGSLCCVLSSCMVGPDFRPPPRPVADRFTEKPIPTKTVSAPSSGGQSQKLLRDRDIPAEWWALFHSQSLNYLVELGILNSPNLAAAQAAIYQARQNFLAEEGQLFPVISLAASATRQRFNQATFGLPMLPSTTLSLYNVSFNVSYVFDLFGGIRRQIEALGAQVDYEQFEWEATYLTLTANIVTTAITEASLREQIATTLSLIKAQRKLLEIIEKQFKLGGVNKSQVLTQSTLLSQTIATLPPLQKSLALNRDALAALVGRIPSESELPKFYLTELKLPKELPVSIPSEWVCQRPDIQAASALLHAASAQIGVATANFFPQITLTANYGWISTMLSTLFNGVNSVWAYGGNLVQPLFEGGTLIAKRRAAIEVYAQAAAQYQQTVLQAFQNVADALNALEIDAKNLRAEAQAENSAQANFILARKQYKLGAISYLSLLNAQLQYQQTSISRIRAEAQRYADTAALFQALGGGWWNAAYHPEGTLLPWERMP